MDKFVSVEVLPTGDLVPVPANEFKVLLIPNVTLHSNASGKGGAPRKDGVLVVTSHRVAWMRGDRRAAVAVQLQTVRRTPLDYVSSLRGAKADLCFGDGTRQRLEFVGGGASTRRDQLRSALAHSCERRQWVADAKADAAAEARRAAAAAEALRPQVGAAHAGVGGAIRRVQQRAAARESAIATGFQSLEGLRAAAQQLLDVARALQGASAGAGDKENNALLDAMSAAGIPSPVTRSSAAGGTQFYRAEVAREMAAFLLERLPLLGGLLTIPDAYLLVTRNRSTSEVVSPDDFRAAVDMLPKLDVGLRVVKLPGGEDAVECDMRRGAGGQKLLELVESNTSMGAVDVARVRNVPLSRALRMLEDAEKAGLLARDDTDGVLRFFPNRFPHFAKQL